MYNSGTKTFTIQSLTSTARVDQTTTITMTATLTLPAGYVGTSPTTVSYSVIATLYACRVDSV